MERRRKQSKKQAIRANNFTILTYIPRSTGNSALSVRCYKSLFSKGVVTSEYTTIFGFTCDIRRDKQIRLEKQCRSDTLVQK